MSPGKDEKATIMKSMRAVWKRVKAPPRRDWLMLALGAAVVGAAWVIVHFVNNAKTAISYQSAGITAPWIPATVKHWSPQIDEMGKRYNLDPNFIAIIMTMESGGDASAQSGAGAVGLMQVTPLTAKDIAKMYLKKPVAKYNLLDPATNIEFGTAYLAKLRQVFEKPEQGPSWDLTAESVAASYNAGFLAGIHLEEGKGLQTTQPLVYSRDAFNMWRERQASSSPDYNRWLERGGSRLIDAAKAHQQ